MGTKTGFSLGSKYFKVRDLSLIEIRRPNSVKTSRTAIKIKGTNSALSTNSFNALNSRLIVNEEYKSFKNHYLFMFNTHQILRPKHAKEIFVYTKH